MTNRARATSPTTSSTAVETATAKWTRQKKSEERHPGNVRYRVSRMTREPRTTQKEAAWEVMEAAYMAASGRRHAAGQGAANLLPGAAQDHGADRRQGAPVRIFLARPCCPTTSRSTASTGTSSMTRAGISRSRTPTGASAAGRSRSATISTRRRSRTSSPPTSPARASTSSVRPGISPASCSAKRKASARCSRR